MEAPPAGKPTSSAASPIWETCSIRKLRGVGRPAPLIVWRVACLSLAASTAAGVLPGRANFSARRDTNGTAISQKVQTPSNSPYSYSPEQ